MLSIQMALPCYSQANSISERRIETVSTSAILTCCWQRFTMNEILCDHCEGPLTGIAYHVISEEDGVILLDMVVCHGCYLEARRIGLETAELGSVIQEVPGRS